MTYQKEKQKQLAKDHALYKHGFRLLEEQLATYIKEHYEGVRKIEFSPIFEDGGDGYSMHTLDIVLAIHDNYGNRAVMKRKINESFGLSEGLSLDFDGVGKEVIELKKYDSNEVIDVSGYEHLPENAKLSSYHFFDELMGILVQTDQLKGIQKSNNGSPDAEVVYNLDIKRGDYTKWR